MGAYVQVVGIPGFVDGKIRQLSRQLLQRMNIAQLQVVVNDLHTQIEGQWYSVYAVTELTRLFVEPEVQ